MNIVVAVLIVLISGFIGIYCDVEGILDHPADFWLLGSVTGLIAGVVGVFDFTKEGT